jgi:serine protease Do
MNFTKRSPCMATKANRQSLFVLIILLTLLICYSVTAQISAHPKRGTTTFGAPERPIKTVPPEVITFKNIFIQTAKKVTPCVVAVLPTKIDTVLFYRNPFYRFFGGDGDSGNNQSPFDNFFDQKDRDNDKENGPPVEKRTRRVQALGSGVIVASEGYVLTNFHVINGATEIEIRLSDDRSFKAKIIGSDSLSDVAVIKITGDIPKDLPVAYLGNSDSLLAGEWVAAIGNPFNLLSTITAGIVSALNRQVEPDISLYQNFIQTDAAINPGNSGGALVNVLGEVIGINTLIYSETGGFMGIGFAIPINMAKSVAEDLIYEGKVIRGWIGVTVQELSQATREALGIKGLGGVLVSDVYKEQPADKAGIKRGDVIMSINNVDVGDPNDLRNVVAAIRPGTEVPIMVFRNKTKLALKIKVSERTPEALQQSSPPNSSKPPADKNLTETKFGISVIDLTTEIRNQFNIPNEQKGAVIGGVDQSLTDARQSLQPGDLIIEAKIDASETKKITSVKDFIQFSKAVKKGQIVLLLILKDRATFYIPFKYEG